MARKPASEQGDTLEEIRAAAFSLFGRHGYDGVSMGKVAAAANITKAAIYWHYKDKKELYLDCLGQLYEIFRAYVISALIEADTPGERIFNLFVGTGQLLRDPRIQDGVAGYWLEAKTADLAQARSIQDSFEEEARQAICSTLQAAIDSGEFDAALPVEDLAQAIISLMEAIVLPMRRSSEEQTQRLIRTLTHTFFAANATDPALAQRALALVPEP